MLATLDGIVTQLDQGRPLAQLLASAPPPAPGPVLEVLRALAQRPWPAHRESVLALRRLVQQLPPEHWPSAEHLPQALAGLLSSGPEMGRLLHRRPQRLQLLAPPLTRPWSRHQLQQALNQQLSQLPDELAPEQLAAQLTAFRNDHVLRLAACEFLHTELVQVGRELAWLADVCLERAMDCAVAHLTRRHGPPTLQGSDAPCQLAAVAMGKYGAEELNFCSDIDLVFIYSADEGRAGELTLHEFFARACQLVTRMLSEPNAEGSTFRVDLRLRPEGSRGPICNSLESAERYYETWGGPYDRLAWLKARPAAGALPLGQELCDVLRPFVFPRSLDATVVQQLQQLYARITAELRSVQQGWNVKLGPGGIRQVEFVVQALQLLHAGKLPALQQRSTLAALDQLLFHGLLTHSEQRALAEAYELWRRLEHRLQLEHGRQTHLLPDAPPEQQRMALHLGLAPDALPPLLRQHRQRVERIFATLDSASEPPAGVGPTPLASPGSEVLDAGQLLPAELSSDELQQRLQQAGFAAPERAAEALQALAQRPWGPLGRAASSSLRPLGPLLLREVQRSPDPDAALHHLVALTLRVGPYEGLWRLLLGHPATLRLLMSLFGSSDHLARLFVRHPELVDRLLMTGRARTAPTAESLARELDARLGEGARAEGGGDPADLEAQLNLLRRFRNEEVLRIGLHDIAGSLQLEQVWAQLTQLADLLLGRLFPLVWREITSRYGTPRSAQGQPSGLTVVGLGTLGSGEMSYASDLDLIFVYDGEGATHGARSVDNSEFFTRLAQRLVGALTMNLDEGRLYAVDTRLRPSGNQGTLVASWDALCAYHARSAQIWERQILLKARSVAGAPELGRRLDAWIQDVVFAAAADPDELAAQMVQHRQRIEKELAQENGDFYNLKLGRGGLLDIDFIAQFYQLCHGNHLPQLRQRQTLDVLAALERARLMVPAQVERLSTGYRFLRRLEHRLRIVRDRSAERLPRHAAGLEVMARRLGYRQQPGQSPGQQLLHDYRQTTESIRGIYQRIFNA